MCLYQCFTFTSCGLDRQDAVKQKEEWMTANEGQSVTPSHYGVNAVNLTAVDVKDMNKRYVNSASAHTCIYFLFSVEVHSSRLSSSRA